MMEISLNDEIEALVWFNYLGTMDVIECHAVCHPDSRGRWLNRSIYNTIHDVMVEDSGAHACVAQVYTPLVERIWRAFGFTIHGNIATYKFKED
jgi:hypothetical protein